MCRQSRVVGLARERDEIVGKSSRLRERSDEDATDVETHASVVPIEGTDAVGCGDVERDVGQGAAAAPTTRICL